MCNAADTPTRFSFDAADLDWKLLEKNPEIWLGGDENGTRDIRRHPFFNVNLTPSVLSYNSKVFTHVLVVDCALSMQCSNKIKHRELSVFVNDFLTLIFQ